MFKNNAMLYRTYLLRCWREPAISPDMAYTWRFCVEEIAGERRRLEFVSLESAMEFLQAELVSDEYRLNDRRVTARER
jgi:hypothetical protein